MAAGQSLSPQVVDLLVVYGATAAPMGLALIQQRARAPLFFRWPIVALLATAAGVILWWLIRSRILAANPHTNLTLLWFVGVFFFAVLGYCAGIVSRAVSRGSCRIAALRIAWNLAATQSWQLDCGEKR